MMQLLALIEALCFGFTLLFCLLCGHEEKVAPAITNGYLYGSMATAAAFTLGMLRVLWP